MANTVAINVEPRKIFGRKVKTLRKVGVLPANIFGRKVKSTSIQLNQSEFSNIFKDVGETSLLTLKLKGSQDRPVLVSNVQMDPITDLPIHVDFHQVDLKEKVTATVPLETVGEAPAVKEKGGVLFVTHNELEVEALPMDLPNKLEVNLSSLKEIGDSLLIKDLKVAQSKVKLLLDSEETIAVIQEQKEEEEGAVVEAAEGEEGEETSATEDGETESKETKPEEKTGDKPNPNAGEKETAPKKEESKKE